MYLSSAAVLILLKTRMWTARRSVSELHKILMDKEKPIDYRCDDEKKKNSELGWRLGIIA
jgi:hypothetical protein